MRQSLKALVMFATLLTTSTVFAAETYTIDKIHGYFAFSVPHYMLYNVRGQFDKFEGTITYDPTDLADSKADITIDAGSINTRKAKRDEHLRSAVFFDIAQFPKITFVSTQFTPTTISGNLTMRGITQPVTIPVTITGPLTTMLGGKAIGITGSVVVNRQNWGLSWNKFYPGGEMISDNVTIIINLVGYIKASIEPMDM